MAERKSKSSLIKGLVKDKIPPQAIDAEQAILGAMLIYNEAVPQTLELITADDFYREAHRKIFRAIVRLFDKGEATDLMTVTDELIKEGELEDVGGRGYITSLTESVATAGLVTDHCRIVLEKSTLNQLITAATSIISECYGPIQDVDDLLDRSEHKIFAIREGRLKQTFVQLPKLLPHAFDIIADYSERDGELSGVPSGFGDLDTLTAGFQKSDLIIIASRPSMGKTALSLAIATNVALRGGVVGFFSLEMSKEQLVQRIICSQAKISSLKLRKGLRKHEIQSLLDSATPLMNAPIFIDDSANIGVLEMKAKARRLKSHYGLALVIVDYLQLMRGPRSAENRNQEISYISRSLKAMAKELDVPVVALSQLSRDVEKRGGEKRPQLSDLRESGSIEQDADVVMFIYRPAFYGKTFDKDGNSLENLAEVIISKQRNGPTGTVKLAFVREYASFYDLERSHREPISESAADSETTFP